MLRDDDATIWESPTIFKMLVRDSLRRFDAGILDDLGPFGGLGGNIGAKLLRRLRHERKSLVGELLLHGGVRHRLRCDAVQRRDDGGRRR